MNAAFNSEIVTAPSIVARSVEPPAASNQDLKTFTQSLLAQWNPSSEADVPSNANTKDDLYQGTASHDAGPPVRSPHVPVILSPVRSKLALAADTAPRNIAVVSSPRPTPDVIQPVASLSALPWNQGQRMHVAGQTLPPAHGGDNLLNQVALIPVSVRTPEAVLTPAVTNAQANSARQIIPAPGSKTHNAVANQSVIAGQSTIPVIAQAAPKDATSHQARSATWNSVQRTQASQAVADSATSQSMLPRDEPSSTVMIALPGPNAGLSAREGVHQWANDLQVLTPKPSSATKPAPVPLATVLAATSGISIKPSPVTAQRGTASSVFPFNPGLSTMLSNAGDHGEPPALHPSTKASPMEESPRFTRDTTSQASTETPASDSVTSTPATPNETPDQVTAQIQSGVTSVSTLEPTANSAASFHQGAPTSFGLSSPDVSATVKSKEVSPRLQPVDPSQSQTASGDQPPGKVVLSPPDQSVVPVLTSVANHILAASDHIVNTATPVSPQASSAPAAHSAKLADNQAAPLPAEPPALPVVNTARLIQNLGQAEMHVGMRSADFGNISITTSATRNLISAQIALDHSDLARTLAVHLPEMQAKLSSNNQTLNMRIDLNGNAAGPGTGTSANDAAASQGGSRDAHPQKRSAGATQAAVDFNASRESASLPVSTIGELKPTVRLDITA